MDAKKLESLMGFEAGELEETVAAYESGEWPEGHTVRLGRPPLTQEPTTVISGRVGVSVAKAFDQKAHTNGQTRAERLRDLIYADAMSA